MLQREKVFGNFSLKDLNTKKTFFTKVNLLRNKTDLRQQHKMCLFCDYQENILFFDRKIMDCILKNPPKNIFMNPSFNVLLK